MLPHFEGLLSIFDDRLSGRVPCCNPTRPAIESLRGPERDPRYLQALTSARATGCHQEGIGGIGRVELSNRSGGVIPPDETLLRFTRGFHLLLSCSHGLRWHELQFKKSKPR